MTDNAYSRRRFIHMCSAAAGLVGATAMNQSAQALTTFERVRLIDTRQQPIRLSDLEVEREYVFFYPYVCTPCFLLKLDQPTAPVELTTADGTSYQWQGGIGPDHSVVAFAAICAHKMTHPSGPVSFIGYRQKPVGFLDEKNNVVRRSGVIQCCSEQSIYDPAQGAKVLAGPAPQPLASIELAQEDGVLYAAGVYGGALYPRFFERFGFRLAFEFGADAMTQVAGESVVMPMEEYTKMRVEC